MVTIKEPFDIRILQGLDSGGSLGVTLPKMWALQLGLKKGDRLKLTKINEKIVIEKLII